METSASVLKFDKNSFLFCLFSKCFLMCLFINGTSEFSNA